MCCMLYVVPSWKPRFAVTWDLWSNRVLKKMGILEEGYIVWRFGWFSLNRPHWADSVIESPCLSVRPSVRVFKNLVYLNIVTIKFVLHNTSQMEQIRMALTKGSYPKINLLLFGHCQNPLDPPSRPPPPLLGWTTLCTGIHACCAANKLSPLLRSRERVKPQMGPVLPLPLAGLADQSRNPSLAFLITWTGNVAVIAHSSFHITWLDCHHSW